LEIILFRRLQIPLGRQVEFDLAIFAFFPAGGGVQWWWRWLGLRRESRRATGSFSSIKPRFRICFLSSLFSLFFSTFSTKKIKN